MLRRMSDNTRVHIGQGKIQHGTFGENHKLTSSLSAPWPPKMSSSQNARGKCMVCRDRKEDLVNGICRACDSPKTKGKTVRSSR